MFFTYLKRELLHRSRQAVVVALGLAVGIGLVVTVSAAASGVKVAQTSVLHSLYGVGTDITVTEAPTFNAGGGAFQFTPGAGTQGQAISRDALRVTRGESTFSTSYVAKISKIPGVSTVTADLNLSEINFSGSFGSVTSGATTTTVAPATAPSSGTISSTASVTSVTPSSGPAGTTVTISGTGFTGATAVTFGTVSATSFTVNSPTSITAVVPAGASGSIVDVVVTDSTGATTPTGAADGFTYSTPTTSTTVAPTTTAPRTTTTQPSRTSTGSVTPTTTTGGGSPGGGTGRFGINAGPFSINTTTVDGISTTVTSVGPATNFTISSGRFFTSKDNTSAVAIVDSAYASQNSLKVGSTVTIGGTSFSIIGVASESANGTSANYYIPLAEAQSLSSNPNVVSAIYVKTASSGDVSAVAAKVKSDFKAATITTSASLASAITGSLSSTSKLANSLGKWLEIIAVIAAFALASLLTLSGVSRRVRELGTLKALGWKTRRVITQILGESITLGVIGGALGAAIGLLGAKIVAAVGPLLTATVGVSNAFNPGGGGFASRFAGGPLGGAAGSARTALRRAASPTVSVHLTAPVSISVVLLAIGLAVLGGVIAGCIGGWRAARMTPADALRKVA